MELIHSSTLHLLPVKRKKKRKEKKTQLQQICNSHLDRLCDNKPTTGEIWLDLSAGAALISDPSVSIIKSQNAPFC